MHRCIITIFLKTPVGFPVVYFQAPKRRLTLTTRHTELFIFGVLSELAKRRSDPLPRTRYILVSVFIFFLFIHVYLVHVNCRAWERRETDDVRVHSDTLSYYCVYIIVLILYYTIILFAVRFLGSCRSPCPCSNSNNGVTATEISSTSTSIGEKR